MALRGSKPTAITKRMKALFFGPAGVGKTTAAIQFPRPYLIDTERGAENDQYVKLLDAAGGAYYSTTDPDDLITEVKSLLAEKHEFRTLIIDPLTVIYNDLLDRAAEVVGTDFGRHKGPADRKIKHLINLLLRLDMNVIITSHAKPNWARSVDSKGKDTVVQEGVTYDCYARLDYIFDLVFEVSKRGTQRVGIVRKTRVTSFPEGDVLPFSYDEIADRYGREVLERGAKPQTLATADQVADLKRLVHTLKVESAIVAKWLDKAQAESFDEMPSDAISKCIQWCKSQIETSTVEA